MAERNNNNTSRSYSLRRLVLTVAVSCPNNFKGQFIFYTNDVCMITVPLPAWTPLPANWQFCWNSGETIYRIFRFARFSSLQRGSEFSMVPNYVTLHPPYEKSHFWRQQSFIWSEVFHLLWDSKNYCRVHWSPNLEPIPSQYINMHSCAFLWRYFFQIKTIILDIQWFVCRV